MAFLTDALAKQALADVLKKNSATWQPYWDTIYPKAHSWAYYTILNALAAQGYTKTQIDSWDYGDEFETDLFLWRALSRAEALDGNTTDRLLETLDRREDLKEMQGLLIGGEWTAPEGTAGTFHVGQQTQSDDDVFKFFDPNDRDFNTITDF